VAKFLLHFANSELVPIHGVLCLVNGFDGFQSSDEMFATAVQFLREHVQNIITINFDGWKEVESRSTDLRKYIVETYKARDTRVPCISEATAW
jgi:cytochrome c oxidase assembly protein Cox11